MVDRSAWDPEMAALGVGRRRRGESSPADPAGNPAGTASPHQRRVEHAHSPRADPRSPRSPTVGSRRVAGAFTAASTGRARTRSCPCWSGSMAVAGSGLRSIRMTACAANTPAPPDVAVVSVDYALSPEAKFPQALEECAAVVRHIAETWWGLGAGWLSHSGRRRFGGRQSVPRHRAAAARFRRTDVAGHRRVLSGVRQPLRHPIIRGIRRRRLRIESPANGILLERLRDA